MESSSFSYKESITLDFPGAFAALKADFGPQNSSSAQPHQLLTTGRDTAAKAYQDLAGLLLRGALAVTFLSAVASRLGWWGAQGSSWAQLLTYTHKVNSFAPAALVPYLAIAATALESTLAILLLIGYQTRRASWGAAGLTLAFALAMTYSFGVKEPLDYSVWVVSAAALLLATLPAYRWSLDEYIAPQSSGPT